MSNTDTTSPGAASRASAFAPKMPEWVHLPRRGEQCPFTGVSRSTMWRLAVPCTENNFIPPVRSVVLKRPGMVRGRRKIHLASLLAYIDSCPSNPSNRAAA